MTDHFPVSIVIPAYNEEAGLPVVLAAISELAESDGLEVEVIVVDDGYDLFLTLVLYPSFGWEEPAYHLEGDPEGRSFADILVDVVAAEIIEPWGGGKWHLEIFRTSHAEPRTRRPATR